MELQDMVHLLHQHMELNLGIKFGVENDEINQERSVKVVKADVIKNKL
jgi:hypothetical protein